MEKMFLAKTVEVHLMCDTEGCGAEMEFASVSWGAYMTQEYHYVCPKCGATVKSTIKYPELRTIPTSTPVLTK